MLNTNLASRPFYDDRALKTGAAVAAVLIGLLTIYNGVSLVGLRLAQSRLGVHAAEAEGEAVRLRTAAAGARTRIDPKEMQNVASAAREANGIIDQRTFSWTSLFAQLEATLPPDVRIRAVQPRVDKGVFRIVISAQARRVEDLETFIESLERTGAFSAVSPLEETSGEDGAIDAVLEGTYRAPPAGGGQ